MSKTTCAKNPSQANKSDTFMPLPLSHQAIKSSHLIVSTLYTSLIEKAFSYKKRIKKTSAEPVPNPNTNISFASWLSIMMSFTVCMKESFWWIWRELGLACLRSLQPYIACFKLIKNLATFILLVCLIVELLGVTAGQIAEKRKASGTGQIATSYN